MPFRIHHGIYHFRLAWFFLKTRTAFVKWIYHFFCNFKYYWVVEMRKDRYTYKGLRSVLSHRESSVSICPHCVSEHQYYWHKKSSDWLKSAFFFMLFVSLMYNSGLQSEVCFSFPLFCALIASGLIHFFHYHNVLPLGVLIINESRISVKKHIGTFFGVLTLRPLYTSVHEGRSWWSHRGFWHMYGPRSAVRSVTLG